MNSPAKTRKIGLPFGNEVLELEIPEKNLSEIILPSEPESREDEVSTIKKTLEEPIGTVRLSELVNPEFRVAIIVSDITRPTPSAKILPPLLEELRLGGVRDENITIIFALGLHRRQTEEECRRLIGNEIFERFHCLQHDREHCRHIGETGFGTPVEIYEKVLDADFIVGTGTIEFHYYAGYGGGGKCILPGVSSERAVLSFHSFYSRLFEGEPLSGRVDSPARQNIEEAAKIAGLGFILNAVIDSKKKIVAAVSGDFIKAHRKGAEYVDSMYKVEIEPADAVIASCGGFPKDINLYQATKALENAIAAVKKGGSIVLAAECPEGLGNRVYECWSRECKSPEEAVERFRNNFEFGGHKSAIVGKAAKDFKLYMVSKLSEEDRRSTFFTPVGTVQEALETILAKNPEARVHVMPDGGRTLPVRKES